MPACAGVGSPHPRPASPPHPLILPFPNPLPESPQSATQDVYGTAKGGSLEDTVGRRAYFNERRDGGGSAFRKGG